MDILWEDRKRHMGIPMSFTKYVLTDDRILCDTGLINTKEEEINLYRVSDIVLHISLWQRICRVGSIKIESSDITTPKFTIENIKDVRTVKELIFEKVEKAKEKRRVRSTELLYDNSDTDVEDMDDMTSN